MAKTQVSPLSRQPYGAAWHLAQTIALGEYLRAAVDNFTAAALASPPEQLDGAMGQLGPVPEVRLWQSAIVGAPPFRAAL